MYNIIHCAPTYTVFPRKDVEAIYFSSTAMRRLFEGGYYSKYRRRGYYLFQRYRNATTIRGRLLFERGYYSKYRRRGYYLFQLYRNAATIRGRLLFEVQTPRLLFISALPQCGDCSRAATIRSTDVVATIYFNATAMRRLFEGGYYSSAATIRSTDVAATIYFSSTAMRRLFEGGYYSKYRRRGYYLFQRYRNAATIRGQVLFEGGYYSRCGVYSRKYGIPLIYLCMHTVAIYIYTLSLLLIAFIKSSDFEQVKFSVY